jgi:hypothetical protein
MFASAMIHVSSITGSRDAPLLFHPYEWCFSQLEDTALDTLRIQDTVLRHDMTLREASVYRIQFPESRPISPWQN